MQIANDQRRFTFEAANYRAVIRATMARQTVQLFANDTLIGEDAIDYGKDGTRNLFVRAALGDGRSLEVEAGYINWITVAIAVRVDGALIHESHPGRVIRWPERFAIKPGETGSSAHAENMARLKRNWPSLVTDLALGLMFFLVGREYGIVTAAVVGAIAGVLLFVVQKLTRIDLLGGLAVFGIVISIISAAFALAFQDPMIVQMRTTIIGIFVAALFLGDGLLLQGRFLGARLERYMPPGTHVGRLSAGIGVLGVFMAGANAAVAAFMSEDAWLFYTTFLDTPLAIALGVGVMAWARQRPTLG